MKNRIYKYLSKEIVDNEIITRWNESHRFYHNIDHLNDLLNKLEKIENDTLFDDETKDIFCISAYFHDIVYNPKKTNNEEKSVELLNEYTQIPSDIREIVSIIIMDTAKNNPPNLSESFIFWTLDRSILNESLDKLIEYENKIFKEFQFLPYQIYKEKRINFLSKQEGDNIKSLISYINARKPSVGIYAGSFNPFHIGHYDILKKSEKIFDKIIIAFGNNPDKEKRNIVVPDNLQFYQVDEYNGLITDYIDYIENNGVNATLIRGIRNGTDLDYESNQLSFINEIKPNVKVIYIPCDKQYEHISSSSIRNLMKFNKDIAQKYIIK